MDIPGINNGLEYLVFFRSILGLKMKAIVGTLIIGVTMFYVASYASIIG